MDNHSKVFCLTFFLNLCIFPGNINATEVSGPVVIKAALAEADYPPFYYIDKRNSDNKLTGISIDVLSHVAKELNYHIKYKRMPWPRVLSSLESGTVDIVTTFFNTPERSPFVVYTGIPHAYESSNLFTLRNKEISYDGKIQSLASIRLGAIRGYSYGKEFDKADYLIVDRVLDEPTLVRMMSKGRFDAAIGNSYAIRLEASRQNNLTKFKFIEPSIDQSPIFMAVTREHPDAIKIASLLTEQIYELKQTPMYNEWLKKYQMHSSDF